VNSFGNFNIHAVTDHPDTTFSDADGIVPGNLFVYCLIAVDSVGNQSEFSDSVQVGIPKIDWSLFTINNQETTFVSLDSVISDPDHSWNELTPVISNQNNLDVWINNGQLVLSPNPIGFFGNASFFFEVFDPGGFSDVMNIDLNIIQTTPSGLVSQQDQIPEDYYLYQNYPNPFNPSTQIKFSLPKSSKIRFVLYNTLGEKVETVYWGNLSAGTYVIDFNGQHLSSGMYLLQMETSEFSGSIKIILTK
jgi:hypothetical protein